MHEIEQYGDDFVCWSCGGTDICYCLDEEDGDPICVCGKPGLFCDCGWEDDDYISMNEEKEEKVSNPEESDTVKGLFSHTVSTVVYKWECPVCGTKHSIFIQSLGVTKEIIIKRTCVNCSRSFSVKLEAAPQDEDDDV